MLSKTLDRICQIEKPRKNKWELVIVNNNSTDNTEKIISEYIYKLPIIKLFQPKQGLSNARNLAIEKSQGTYIIWTDDDVLVSDNWLIAYEEAFEKYPDAAVFGGPVTPWFETEPPKWLSENWGAVANAYAVRDLGDVEIPLDHEHGLMPFGANFCISAAEQKKHPYNPNLGRNGNISLLGEETEVLNAILEKGSVGWWIPKASVQHWIPQHRMTTKYIRSYYRGFGRTRVILSDRDPSIAVLGIPRWKIRRFLFDLGKFIFKRSIKGKSKSLHELCELETNFGEIIQYIKNKN